jgi:hypothetical protein
MTTTNPQTAEAVLYAAPSPIARYSAALLNIAITLVGAFVLIPADTFAGPVLGWLPAALGLLVVALGAVGTYAVPLLGARESAILKVVVSIAAGIIASVIDFVSAGEFTMTSVAFLVLAVLNGLGTQIGVQIRKESGEGGRHAAAPVA